MAKGKIIMNKASGGVLNVTSTDGTTSTDLVLPLSGTVTNVNTAVTDNAIARFDGTTGTLQNSGVTIDDSGNVGSGTQTFNGYGGSGFKNYIINGNFSVWQRGTSFTGLTNTTYSADRWVLFGSVGDESYNVIRNASTAFSGGYSGVFTITGGTGVKSIMQWVEDFTRFNVGDVYTLSFEAYTNSTPYNITPALQCVNGVWASSSAESSNGTVTITNTKQRFSVQLTIPNWTGLSFNWALLNDTRLAVKLNIGSEVPLNSNFIISNVQLEKGSVATPFEQRPVGLELSLCQRYFEKSYSQNTDIGTITLEGASQSSNLTNWLFSMPITKYKVAKRGVPTVTLYNPYVLNQTNNGIEYNIASVAVSSRPIMVSGTALQASNENQFTVQSTNGTLTTDSLLLWHWTANAEL